MTRIVNPTVAVKLGNRRIACEIAASSPAQQQGLQGVRLLPGTGMLFPWEQEHLRSFHMGDVSYPIQVGFYRKTGKCVRVASGVPGQDEQWTGLAQFVLETIDVQDRHGVLELSKPAERFVRQAVNKPYLTEDYWPMPTNNLFGEDLKRGEDGSPGESKEPGGTWAEAHDPVKRHPSATGLGPGEFTQFNQEDPLFGDSVSDSVSEDWAQHRRASIDPQDLVNVGAEVGQWVVDTRSGVDWRVINPRMWQSSKYRHIVEALGYDRPFEVGILSLAILPTSLKSAAFGSDDDFRIASEALLTSEGIKSFSAKLLESGLADIVKSDDAARELILVREIQ